MMLHKRLTVRQGFIADAAQALDRKFIGSSESNYRQNIWTILDESLAYFPARQRYYAGLSSVGLTRLYNAIAKQAAILAGTYSPAKLTAAQFNRKPRMFDYLNKR